MDKITFFEQALHTLGDREYKRDSPTGKECDLWFPGVLREALNYGSWSFAVRKCVLEPNERGFYPLPEDCLRPLKINHSKFELMGRNIYLDVLFHPAPEEGLELTYISDSLGRGETLPDDEPLFLNGLRLLMAARLAPKITGQPQLAFSLEEAARSSLGEALHQNSLAQHSNDQHPLKWIMDSSIVG